MQENKELTEKDKLNIAIVLGVILVCFLHSGFFISTGMNWFMAIPLACVTSVIVLLTISMFRFNRRWQGVLFAATYVIIELGIAGVFIYIENLTAWGTYRLDKDTREFIAETTSIVYMGYFSFLLFTLVWSIIVNVHKNAKTLIETEKNAFENKLKSQETQEIKQIVLPENILLDRPNKPILEPKKTLTENELFLKALEKYESGFSFSEAANFVGKNKNWFSNRYYKYKNN